MKAAFTLLLLLAAPLAAQDMTCPMHQQHTSHQADVEQHGDEAMGFGHDKTTHHFLLYRDGGAIEVTANDDADTESISAIRGHMTHIATMFSNGDFSTPMFVHSRMPPGVPTMQKQRSDITYAFKELAGGAEIQIKSSNADAVKAVHEFLRFQISDHQTGDSAEIQQPR